MYPSVSKNVILIFGIWYSSLMDWCFVLSLFKNFIRFFSLSLHIKNISLINLREINENPLINEYISLFFKMIHTYIGIYIVACFFFSFKLILSKCTSQALQHFI